MVNSGKWTLVSMEKRTFLSSTEANERTGKQDVRHVNLLGAIDMDAHIKANNMQSRIFALVHDSILAEVPDGELDIYMDALQHYIQRDRGLSISNAPIGCDFEVGDDYSMGKFDKQYGDYMND